MSLSDEITNLNTVFIDTAPIIYFIEAHPQFGPIIKGIVERVQSGVLNAFTSVITLTEVLSKPSETGQEELVKKFTEFLKYGRNLTLIEISVNIAERAGRLRGHYPFLKAMDAIQLSVALEIETDAFLTNDTNLKQIREIKVLVLKDWL